MLEAYHKRHSEPKTVIELKEMLQSILYMQQKLFLLLNELSCWNLLHRPGRKSDDLFSVYNFRNLQGNEFFPAQ